MTFLQGSLKRTLTALAVGLPECSGLPISRAPYIGNRCLVGTFSSSVIPGGNVTPRTFSSSVIPGGNLTPRTRSRSIDSRLFSTFQAPEPPQSKGFNIFDDIDVVSDSTSSQSSLRNSDPDAVFVINGASRGIGFQFVRKLLNDTKGKIVACCRSPDNASYIQEFISTIDEKSRQRIELVQLDVENQDSIEKASQEIKSKYNRIDLLLNVAGILGDGKSTPGPERSVTKIEREWMEKTFQVNVIGPVMLSKELAPLMAQKRVSHRKKADGDQVEEKRAPTVIANLSARVGSISDNGLGGWYSYRMSKAALNQATRTLANELKRQSVWCIALHPGTTDTDLSQPFQRNVQEGRLFPVEFTVDSLMKVIDGMDEENSGGLYDWAGKAIPF